MVRKHAAALAGMVFAIPSWVVAQQSAPDEIIVTATRRAEEESKVPISIIAYGADRLAADRIEGLAGLAAVTPGMEFDFSAGFGPGTKSNLALRGISSRVGTSTTGIYIDEAPVQSRTGTVSLFGSPLPLTFDLDRVEVARGPQGTLFGAGSEGGTLRFISRQPGLTSYSMLAEGEADATLRGGPSYETGAALGGPIVPDKAGFRVSVWQRGDGGFVDRVDPLDGARVEADANASQSRTMRAAVTVAPTDSLSITPTLFAQSLHNHDSSAYFEYLSAPGSGVFENGRLLRQPDTDSLILPSLKLDASFEGVTLTAASAYSNRWGRIIDDLTSYIGALFGAILPYGDQRGGAYPASYADAAPAQGRLSQRQISQEVRLASNGDGALRWTAGLYYAHGSQDDQQVVYSPFYAANLFGLPPRTQLSNVSLRQADTQTAAYGQVDYRVLGDLTLTLGLRIEKIASGFTQTASGVTVNEARGHGAGSQSDIPLSPKFALDYQVSPSDMAYLSVAKGYRAGGGNPPPFAEVSAACDKIAWPAAYNADSVWSYEIGAKDRAFGGNIEVDTSLFHIDWSTIQQLAGISACALDYVANAGSATSNGFDLSLKARLDQWTALALSAAYTDARMGRSAAVQGGILFRRGDALGDPPFVQSPWNVTASISRVFSLYGQEIDVTVEDVFRSRNPGPFSSMIPGSPAYAPQIPADPATNRLDLRMSGSRGGLTLSLFADNVTNSHPALGRYQDVAFSSLFTDNSFRPLTVGARATYRL